MRITNNIIQREALSSMQSSLRGVAEAQRRVSTGLRIEKASDDPSGSASAMRTRGSLRALDQYRRNIDSAASRAVTEESALNQLSDVMERAREIATLQGTATADPASRAAAKAEVDELISFAVQLGNTRSGEEYLFGGMSNVAPFDLSQPGFLALDGNGDPVVPSGTKRTEIAANQYLTATHDGQQVMIDTGVLQSLKALSDALVSPDAADDTRESIAGLKSAFDGVQNLIGEIGARTNQLEVTGANLDALEINLESLKSNLEEVDLEKAVTELVSRQSAYQAAMLATSRVMGLTLADYLR